MYICQKKIYKVITVYNLHNENHLKCESDFYIGRGSVLGNPYTHIKDKKTLASFVVSSRDEAIAMYDRYFDMMYGSNKDFTEEIDRIYEKYKNGENVYLGCFCHPQACHGDVIKKKLERRLIKEKFEEIKQRRGGN